MKVGKRGSSMVGRGRKERSGRGLKDTKELAVEVTRWGGGHSGRGGS